MKLEQEEVTFQSLVRFAILPYSSFDKLQAGSVTPSVKNLATWIANNAAPLTITNFTNGAIGQRLHVLGDGFTSVANNATIKTRTGAVMLLAANLVYNFTYINNIWYMDA